MKKAPGHGHTTTWYKFWQYFPIILYHFQKDPFCLIILYDILFYFIHVYIAPGQKIVPEGCLGTIFLMVQAERSYHFDHWVACFKK